MEAFDAATEGPASTLAAIPREVAVLAGALAQAAARGFDELDTGTLAALVPVFRSLRRAFESLDARFVAALDRSGAATTAGHRNTAAMLSAVGNEARREARRRVRIGRTLSGCAVVAEAFASGQISAAHVSVFADLRAPRFADRLAEDEALLVRYAGELDWDGFVALVARWKELADASEAEARDASDDRARELHLATSFRGRGILNATLTPLARGLVGGELDRLEDALFQAEWNAAVERLGDGNVTPADLARSPAQRRHDALVAMAERSAATPAASGEPRYLLYVHATQAELEAAIIEATGHTAPPPTDPAVLWRELDDGTPISRATLARLAVHAHVRRVVWDPAGEILDFGRARRFFTPSQREAIAVRDRWCACGCGLGARRCHADHRIEWRHEGLTDIANGQPLCPRSHRLKTARHAAGPAPAGPHADPPEHRDPQLE